MASHRCLTVRREACADRRPLVVSWVARLHLTVADGEFETFTLNKLECSKQGHACSIYIVNIA